MIAAARERMVPNSEVAFRTGYQSIRSFSSGHQRRIRWYQLFLHLEDAVTYQRLGDRQSASGAVERLWQLTDALKP
jgi:hypothetical protein